MTGVAGRAAPSQLRRAQWSLAVLVLLAVLAAGGLTTAIGSPPGPLAGIGFALSALVLVVSGVLASRIVMALERFRRRGRDSAPAPAAAPYSVVERTLRRWTIDRSADASRIDGRRRSAPRDR